MLADQRRFSPRMPIAGGVIILLGCCALRADDILAPDLTTFVLANDSADGAVVIDSPNSFVLTGGNTGSGLPGTTTFTAQAMASGSVVFDWSYASLDQPGFDNAGYIAGNNLVQLADTSGESGHSQFNVSSGEIYGWFADTADNTGEPGVLTVSLGANAETPEPNFGLISLLVLAILAAVNNRKRLRALSGLAAVLAASVHGQVQNHYVGVGITGQITLTNVVHPGQIAPSQSALTASEAGRAVSEIATPGRGSARFRVGPEFPRDRGPLGRPMTFSRSFGSGAGLAVPSLAVNSAPATLSGFNALSHFDQRMADSGNQLSAEPPSPSIAAANGFVLEGVNDAVSVFNASGSAAIPALSSNQWFGLAPQYDRTNNVSGPYLTDMRVYFDSDISRWFVLQRSQDSDSSGNQLDSSHIYMAVSATGDPTAAWNIYSINSTNANNPGCPCVPDYLQVGSDQYGFYISANEYDATYLQPVDATIIAISKAALGSASASPSAVRFQVPFITGYEFAIQPATTPPGASKFVASGGVEFLASSQAFFSDDSQIALWSLSNTASIAAPAPSLLLTQTTVQTEWYYFPSAAAQRPGPIPYGNSLFPPGQLEFLDGNSDSRVQSASYSGGRMCITLPTQVLDSAGNSVVGGAYMLLSPTFRSNNLNATVLEQGYISVTNNHVLRPAVALNSRGAGVIAFTLAGPDYFPSAAYVTLNLLNPPSNVQIAGAGVAPEDGFTGYYPSLTTPVARWGDYSTAAASADGSIWMVTEYVPGGVRSLAANWGTYISHYMP